MKIQGTQPHRDVADFAIGMAAEHLVCADLLLLGYRAFLAAQNCPFDIAVEYESRLVKIQVKATRFARATPQRVTYRPAYLFYARRAGNAGRRNYGVKEFDILACVALDIRQIAYLPIAGVAGKTIHLPPPGTSLARATLRRTIEQYPFSSAVKEMVL